MRFFVAMLLAGASVATVAYGGPARTKVHRLKTTPYPDPNNPPPAGAILDLNGTPIPGGGNGTYQTYSVTFVAAIANTAITFAFREDPAFLFLENVTVVDQTVPGPNLLQNGDFSGGVYTNNGNSATPNHWTYANIYGASFGGVVETSGCGGTTPNSCFVDGAVDSYDAISQTIATTIGHTYKISFALADNCDCSQPFSSLTTNTYAGIDLTVYAQAGLPAAGAGTVTTPVGTPAPGTLALLLLGLSAGSAFAWRDRIRAAIFRR